MVQDEISPGYTSAGSCAACSIAAAGADGDCPPDQGRFRAARYAACLSGVVSGPSVMRTSEPVGGCRPWCADTVPAAAGVSGSGVAAFPTVASPRGPLPH